MTEPDLPCPSCRKPMIQRRSEYGPFWGCSTFPKCYGKRKQREGECLLVGEQYNPYGGPDCEPRLDI